MVRKTRANRAGQSPDPKKKNINAALLDGAVKETTLPTGATIDDAVKVTPASAATETLAIVHGGAKEMPSETLAAQPDGATVGKNKDTHTGLNPDLKKDSSAAILNGVGKASNPTAGATHDGAGLKNQAAVPAGTPSTVAQAKTLTGPAIQTAQKVFDARSKWQVKGQKKTFVELFADNRNPNMGMKLTYTATQGAGVILEDEDVDDITKTWGFCLVGYFTQRHPGKEALMKLCSSWNVPFEIVPDVNGWIVFKFQSEYDRDCVLRGGPYTIYGRSLLLKVMPDWFRFGDDDIKQVPIWIMLPQLPIECYNEKAISKIASCVGKPMTTDKLTQTKERASYARVLVEVDISKELVRSIHVGTRKGVSFEQRIEYENEPLYCSRCNRIGHSIARCKQPQQEHNNMTAESKGTEAPIVHQPHQEHHEETGENEDPATDSSDSTEMVPIEVYEKLRRPTTIEPEQSVTRPQYHDQADGYLTVGKNNKVIKPSSKASTTELLGTGTHPTKKPNQKEAATEKKKGATLSSKP